MKHSSSTTASNANAVRSSGVPRYSSVQRARTIAPIVGMQPAGTAHTNSTQSGVPNRTHNSIAAMDVTLIPRRDGKDTGLPVPVHRPGHDRRDERVGQREHRGEGTGQCVVAAQFGQHRDDADADHGDRYPRNESCGGERCGAGGGEDLTIGTEHASSLTDRGRDFQHVQVLRS